MTTGQRPVTGAPAPPAIPESEPSLLTLPFVFVMLAAFGYFFALGALMPTVPRYVDDELGGNGFEVGLATGAFAVSAALLRPWVGRLGDSHGRRLLVAGGAAIAGVSMLLYPFAVNVPLMVMARLVTGVGEAAVFTGAATAAQDMAPDHRRGEAASYFSVALYAGIAVGPMAGEWLREATNYNAVFLICGAAAMIAALFGLKVPKRAGMPSESSAGGDGPSHQPAAQVQATGARTGWAARILHPHAVGPGVVLFLGLVPLAAFSTFLPLYGEEVGMDNVGGVLGVYAGLVLVVRIVGARLPDRLGWHRGSGLALLGVTAGAAMLGLWQAQGSMWLAAVGLATGMSLLFPSLFLAVLQDTPASERTHAVGTFSLFFDLATGLGAACIGLVVALSNVQGGFAAAALCAGAGLFARKVLAARMHGFRAEVP